MTRRSEPIFNVPPVVIALVASFAFVHLARMFLLTPDQDQDFLGAFAFIPARYDTSILNGELLPGGWAANVWTFVTYAFIHANIPHLVMNSIWLLAFGSPVARRFGVVRFLVLFAVTAAAGAGAHLLTNDQPMIGASAAISGCMGAATRFVFQRGGPLGLLRGGDNDEAYRVPAVPLLAGLRDIRVIVFLGAWFVVNLVFGLGSIAMPGVEEAIAWQAHIGGFLAGLLLFTLFDPVVVSSEPEQHEPHNGEQSQDQTLQ